MNADPRAGTVAGLAGLAILLTLVPLVGTVFASFVDPRDLDHLTTANFALLRQGGDLSALVLRTFALGLGSVLVTMLVALPVTWLMARTDFRWKTALFALLTAKLAIPGFITAMTYVWMFNPNSGLVNQLLGATGKAHAVFDIYQLHWICLLQGLVLVPGAVFMLLPPLLSCDAALEEAALVSGVSRLNIFRSISLQLLRPALLAVAVFHFIVSIEMFDFVAIIGAPGDVLVQRIYRALTESRGGFPSYGRAGVLALILFALCGLAILYYVRLLKHARRFAVVGGKRRQVRLLQLGAWQMPAVLLIALWLTLTIVLPVVTLLWVAVTPFFAPPSTAALKTMTLDGFRDAFSYLPAPLLRTAMLMAGTVIAGVTMGLSLSWIVTRRRTAISRFADALVFLAPAVPAVMAATAFQIFGLVTYRWLPLYGTIGLMIAALATRLLTYTTRTMNGAAQQLAPELEEAALASGIAPGRGFTGTFVPLLRPAIFYAALMGCMLAARDLTLPLIMGTGRTPVLAVLIYDLQTNGEYAGAAAVALILIVLLVTLALVARRLSGMRPAG